jgi:hypothetical protein
MDDFHLVLPSDVNNLSGVENKPGHYTTYLPKTITLNKDEWKVAIVDMNFVLSWFNVTMENCLVILNGPLTDEIRLHIPLNRYENAAALVKAINSLLKSVSFHSYFQLSHTRVTVWIQPHERITLHDITAAMLGFRENKFEHTSTYRGMTPISSARPTNVHLPLQNIYVYSNLVKEIPVGDTYAPLLQVVPVRNDVYGSVQHHQFRNPLYTSLATNDLSVIEVKLCDDRGNVIEFDVGRVVLKLHLKHYGRLSRDTA